MEIVTEDSLPIEPEPLLAPPSPPPLYYPTFPTYLTYILIGANVLVFIPTLLARDTVFIWGALMPELVLRYGQYWRLLSSGFVHASITHIFFNMYALHDLGRITERFLGFQRFAAIYTAAMLGGGLFVILFSPLQSLTVGASGAILGLLGGLGAYLWRYREEMPLARKLLPGLIRTALINVAIGLLPGVSLWGHLGGILLGFAAGWLLCPRYVYVPYPAPRIEIVPWRVADSLKTGGIFIGLGLALGLAIWLRI